MATEERARPDNLGEGPERRMEKLPPEKPSPREASLEAAFHSPGAPKPPEADAAEEGAVQELAKETEGKLLEEKEELTQKDNPRPLSKEPLPDIRRRIRETQAPSPSSEEQAGLEESD